MQYCSPWAVPSDLLLMLTMSTGPVKAKGKPTATRLDGAIQDILLSLLTLTVPMFALVGIFLGLVYANQLDTPENESGSAYYVNYSATRLITVSSWTSTAASLVLPFAATLLAYPIAQSFMKASAVAEHDRLPTPYQLNLIIGLLSGGPGPLWSHLQYLFWARRPGVPRLLTVTSAGVFLFFALGFGILAADTWLHVATTTIPYGILAIDQVEQSEMGRGLSFECFPELDNNTLVGPCISSNSLTGQSTRAIRNSAQAYRTLANLSTVNQVRSSSVDGLYLAYIIAPESGFDLDYSASTFAMETKCAPITSRCGLEQGSFCPRPNCVGQNGLTHTLNFTCPGGLVGNLGGNTGTAFEADGSSSLLQTLTNFFLQLFNDSNFEERHSTDAVTSVNYANPLHFVAGALVPPNDQLSTDSEAIRFTPTDNVGVIFGCHTTIYELDFDFRNGSIVAGTTRVANSSLSSGLGWALEDYRARVGYQSYLDSAITGAGISATTVEEMANRFANSFSEVAMAIHSGILSPRATIDAQHRENVLVARLPKAPFFTLLLLNLIYATLGLLLGITALTSHPRNIRDIQARLTVAGLSAALLEPDGVPQRGEGVEGLFTDKREDDTPRPERRVCVQKLDDRRWAFQLVPLPTLSKVETTTTQSGPRPFSTHETIAHIASAVHDRPAEPSHSDTSDGRNSDGAPASPVSPVST